MSVIRSFRKKIIKNLTGQNHDTKSTYLVFENARSIQDSLQKNHFPEEHHAAFIKQVQRQLNREGWEEFVAQREF